MSIEKATPVSPLVVSSTAAVIVALNGLPIVLIEVKRCQRDLGPIEGNAG